MKVGQWDKTVLIPTPTENSCFHAISNAMYEPYRRGKDRDKIIRDLKSEVSSALSFDVLETVDNGHVMNAISELLSIDIFVITAKGIPFKFPNIQPLRKKRNSVVLIIDQATYHYNLLGMIKSDGAVDTFFKPTHPFIVSLT